MSAIITNSFRRKSCQAFIDEVDNSNKYFIGLGKSDRWPDKNGIDEDHVDYQAPFPENTLYDNQDVLDSLLALVRVKETDVLVPKNPWTSNRKYKIYDPLDPYLFDLEGNEYPCYTTVDDKIFVCLGNDGGISTIIPSSDTTSFDTVNHVKVTSDGYQWAFLQDIDQTSHFYTQEFVPVGDDVTDDDPYLSTGGLIYNFKIISGGFTVTGNEDIILTGIDRDGNELASVNITTDPRFLVNIVSGTITSIRYVDINNDALMGYARAIIKLYDGVVENTDVIIRPIVADINGFGSSPINQLPAYYMGFYARFKGSVDGEALTALPFRQVSLIYDPERLPEDSLEPTLSDKGEEYSDDEALDALEYIQFEPLSITQELPPSSLIRQINSGAKAYLDKVDLVNTRIYYHRNSNIDVNYIPFNTTDDIIIEPITGGDDVQFSASLMQNIVKSEYIHNSGEVLFVNNREKIQRNDNQIEFIKLIAQF